MTKLDPISVEVQWSRLTSIMNDVDAEILRTAFSTVVGEGRDFAPIILDGATYSVAQSQFCSPAFTVSMPTTVRTMLQHFPPETLRQGDVLVTNDPWLAHGHLDDFIFVQPAFWKGRLVAYLACAAHMADVGGRRDEFEMRDTYEEGLHIPPSKLLEQGMANTQLFRIIEANVRYPRLVLGDCYAIAGALRHGLLHLEEFLAEYGPEDFQALCDTILARSEQVMRAAITEIPDGRYEAVLQVDGYQQPVRLQVAITVSGSELIVDYAGSSLQQENAAINCVLNHTQAHTIFAFKCCLTPELPNNEGLFRPISVRAPEGSVFNCRFPAPVKSRCKISHHINHVLFSALADVLPDKIQAGSGGIWILKIWGHGADGQIAFVHSASAGGKGALLGMDGLPTISFPPNGTPTPAEIIENIVPVQIVRRALLSDTGGPGQFRGGLGQELAIRLLGKQSVQLTVRQDKVRIAAPGLRGGLSGARGQLLLDGEPSGSGPISLLPGNELVIRLPGGGGYGDPQQRDRDRLRGDLDQGNVTVRAAKEQYGWQG